MTTKTFTFKGVPGVGNKVRDKIADMKNLGYKIVANEELSNVRNVVRMEHSSGEKCNIYWSGAGKEI